MFQELRKNSASDCGSMKMLPSVAWPHEYLWASTLCSCLERDFTFFKGVTTKSVFFFKHMGGIFCEWHWNKIMHEHVKPKVMTKQVEAWVRDTVFLGLNGANLKNKSPVWGKCLPILTKILHSLPLVNSCRAADLPLNVFTFSSFDCSHMSKSHISCQIQ